jgi:hypothetical protein
MNSLTYFTEAAALKSCRQVDGLLPGNAIGSRRGPIKATQPYSLVRPFSDQMEGK